MAKLVFLGLSLSSSWGNGHATTYRALVRALAQRGHDILFLERDVPWYAEHRDLKHPAYCRLAFYKDVAELDQRHADAVRDADAVIVGSFVPDGIEVGEWATRTANGRTGFYDIDTPETLAALGRGDCAYISPQLIGRYDLYLSFTGGPVLDRLRAMGSPHPAAFYCSVDPEAHKAVQTPQRWLLGYLGTYSADRQGPLERLLFEPAAGMPEKHFVAAGAQYPDEVGWPANVQHIPHLPPDVHAAFYSAQRFTLNITRQAMRDLGWSPSVRLFEAAACGTPIISDDWQGLDQFFVPGEEILIAHDAADVIDMLQEVDTQKARRIGRAARRRVLAHHTAAHRARELESLLKINAAARPRDQVYAINV